MRTSNKLASAVLATALLLPMTYSTSVSARSASAGKAFKAIDTDNDGTIDLKEAQTAGEATFDKLEKDKDGTLTTKELQGRVSKKDLKAADGDSDGTLDKKEYAAMIEQRFKAADPDNDGKLDQKELKSKAGQSLMQLLK